MAYKRPRSTFEADLQAKESPFVTYGTPLPPLDSEARDDGSYVPIWKQEVTDDRGRKRLHGAFTGGFSAGYFNTVGSKDGWAPSTFVSSRSNRRKDDKAKPLQRPEDFMDDEDLAEAAEAHALQTNQSFAGFGSTAEDAKRKGLLVDLLRVQGETMGVKLLRKMGWRDGQGIGPRVRRKARLDEDDGEVAGHVDSDEHLFAPADTQMITFRKKHDQKGLGFEGQAKLGQDSNAPNDDAAGDRDEEEENQALLGPSRSRPNAPAQAKRGGFGMGVLNDTGSDDEDPYEMGPRISYSKVVGGDKKKQKAKAQKPKSTTPNANPLVGNKPIFIPKKSATPTFRKCNDGRLPIDGFLLGEPLDAFSASEEADRYPRPEIPNGWQSSKAPSKTAQSESTTYQSTADAAKLSKLDSKSRAAILGETQLPGKSIFDYLSPAARDRIASATGRSNLPQARNEAIPESSKSTTSASRTQPTETAIPPLSKETALAALGRGTAGWTPYSSEPEKSQRYRALLEFRADLRALPPSCPPDLKPEAWQQELREFAHAAEVFKPMTGLMASRFTSSSAAPKSSAGEEEALVLESPAARDNGKREDPAEEAARLGMFGPMTRSVRTFFPTRLVCKRFGVKPPEHVLDEAKADENSSAMAGRTDGWKDGAGRSGKAPDLVGRADMDRMRQEGWTSQTGAAAHYETQMSAAAMQEAGTAATESAGGSAGEREAEMKIDSERNEALEGKRAGEELFKAIFADDSD